MKNLMLRFLLPVSLLAASAQAHTVAYPHGHPHVTGTTWADLLITGGVIGLVALGTLALLRLRDRQRPVRERIR